MTPGWSTVPSPITTSLPTKQKGPIATSGPIPADGSTRADRSIPRGNLSSRCEKKRARRCAYTRRGSSTASRAFRVDAESKNFRSPMLRAFGRTMSAPESRSMVLRLSRVSAFTHVADPVEASPMASTDVITTRVAPVRSRPSALATLSAAIAFPWRVPGRLFRAVSTLFTLRRRDLRAETKFKHK